ncbi:hypothetical protein L195_g024823 [Trifolium pratense]|uniref:Uncharacterized protein n=1 Tax=Trifolium pratense TaxID=57577 RepID=A0A2K3NER5_TRIPR|nr:hypothetical protein L195_g024823 [Trifolium pratense]
MGISLSDGDDDYATMILDFTKGHHLNGLDSCLCELEGSNSSGEACIFQNTYNSYMLNENLEHGISENYEVAAVLAQ